MYVNINTYNRHVSKYQLCKHLLEIFYLLTVYTVNILVIVMFLIFMALFLGSMTLSFLSPLLLFLTLFDHTTQDGRIMNSIDFIYR